ncbi:MAG: hypothetical protein A2937_04020 [Candidatus Yonathbacteria bacterium RIFCSPLOWO2_01_FULL_47_33b]|uniref:histidine kinase n=1 Tax=Candidatus Yonathbacteria bacterium RIFCSPLOWO2_01_FULL_47_33b TaxID=1802727 RepID=A0A1G2SE57_9BACT|nr:MAG: hypothetical protein A2937_04020 [Candidatus Yonathbacteria bacterium RIFCSPLOWO2_01_FULL_47_33b]
MFKRIPSYFSQGFLFARNNPQIIYTIFLIIVIPLAFLASGQKFLSVAKSNQERLEKERVGVMQDIFVELASSRMNEPAFLQESIERIKAQNEQSISEFKVLSLDGGKRTVIASLNKEEVGTADENNDFIYNEVGVKGDSSKLFTVPVNGERHWNVVRGIVDRETGVLSGILLISVSMASVDAIAMQNIRSAYYFLFFIVLAISILLLRQAKIIDYTVLYKKLQDIDQMKDDFISMAAHELRTPLTVVKGYADMLSESQNLKDDDRENTTRIMASVDQLNALITDVLDVIRLGQGRMTFNMASINATPIIEKVIESFQYVAREKGLEISYEKKDLPNINVDPEKLRQILVNIIGNSIKYTPSGSVKVFAETEHSILSIRVRDTGIGISAEDQKSLFSKFFRVRSKDTEDIRGTGLGLWIAAQVVNNMGGKISVESIKGKGTDFVISFPVVK